MKKKIQTKQEENDSIEVIFTPLKMQIDFEGHTVNVSDANKVVGNLMKFRSSYLDIGFHTLAKEIYEEKPNEKIKILKEYIPYIVQVVKDDVNHQSCLRAAIIELLIKE